MAFYPAFEDSEGLFVDLLNGWDTQEEALKAVEEYNLREVNRLRAGNSPDASWFVVRCDMKYTTVSRPKLPDQTDPLPLKSMGASKALKVVRSKRRKVVIKKK